MRSLGALVKFLDAWEVQELLDCLMLFSMKWSGDSQAELFQCCDWPNTSPRVASSKVVAMRLRQGSGKVLVFVLFLVEYGIIF